MVAIVLYFAVVSATNSSTTTFARFFRHSGLSVALLRGNMGLVGSGLIVYLPWPLFESSSVCVAIVYVLFLLDSVLIFDLFGALFLLITCCSNVLWSGLFRLVTLTCPWGLIKFLIRGLEISIELMEVIDLMLIVFDGM